MAESQDFAVLPPNLLDAVEQAVSPSRFGPYVAAARGDREYAMRLYLWNARLAKAFLFPLAMCEVVTRNAVDDALGQWYGPDWIMAPPFGLNHFSQRSHGQALERLQRAAASGHRPAPTSNDLVAALTFDFWSNLFRPDYDDVWSSPGLIEAAFPNAPPGEDRRQVQKRVATINDLRNRIAHHEPIYDRQDHGGALTGVLDMVGLRSREAREFTRRHSTVMAVARMPPSRESRFPGRPLAQVNLRAPTVLSAADGLDVAIAHLRVARPPVVLLPSADPPGFSAVTIATVGAFIADRAAALGGLVDLSALTLDEVCAEHPLTVGTIDVRASTGDVVARFFDSEPGATRPSLLIVLSAQGVAVGIVVRPDIRF